MKKAIKITVLAVIMLAIIAATVIPIVNQWGGGWYEKAGLECADAYLITQTILRMDQNHVEEKYKEIQFEKLKTDTYDEDTY